MNVRELIEHLQQFDPEAPVVAGSDPECNRDYPVARVEISPWTLPDGTSGTDVYLRVGYSNTENHPPMLEVSP